MTETSDSPLGRLSFEHDIRPLFREKDRTSMLEQFDLWSHSDVMGHQDGILDQLRQGSMPCDGAWPSDQVALFGRWISAGSQP